MKPALVILVALALGACGALRNGGGLMGNQQATGGTIVIIDGGHTSSIKVPTR